MSVTELRTVKVDFAAAPGALPLSEVAAVASVAISPRSQNSDSQASISCEDNLAFMLVNSCQEGQKHGDTGKSDVARHVTSKMCLLCSPE